jgi:hypothetical protein
MKFRFHRGGLDESMATAVDIEPTKVAITKHCNAQYTGSASTRPMVYHAQYIEVKPYGFDSRINWDTYIVTMSGYGVIGFTDGPVTD